MKKNIAICLLLFAIGLFAGYMLFKCDTSISDSEEINRLETKIKAKDTKIDSLINAISITKSAISVTEKEEDEAEEKLETIRNTKDERKKELDRIGDTIYNKRFLDSLATHVRFR